jgi:hypothetical protein
MLKFTIKPMMTVKIKVAFIIIIHWIAINLIHFLNLKNM